jgi:hypothetical protein
MSNPKYKPVYPKPTHKRVKWVKWADLRPIDRKRAKIHYSNHFPWLDWDDWLYPVGMYGRLTRIERGLLITVEEAEIKRHTWLAREYAAYGGA